MARPICGKCHLGVLLQVVASVLSPCGQGALRVGGGRGWGRGYINLEDKVFLRGEELIGVVIAVAVSLVVAVSFL